MPLLNNALEAAATHFASARTELEERLNPEPPIPPALTTPQHLARIALQPDRLEEVKAARNPMLEAARPLLEAIIDLPRELDSQQQHALLEELARKVTAFQSLAQDAELYFDNILIVSYAICTALDEAVSQTPWAKASEAAGLAPLPQLCVRFHGANNGGEYFFRILARMTLEAKYYYDPMEVMLLILAMDFQGMYRDKRNGYKNLSACKNCVYRLVSEERHLDQPHARMALLTAMLQYQPKTLEEVTQAGLFR